MDYAALTLGLALPWLLGIGVLIAIDWPQAGIAPAGRVALRAGFGYFTGVLLLTLWMRMLNKTGVTFSSTSVGAPLGALTLALFAYGALHRRLSRAGAREVFVALFRPPVADWQRMAWLALGAWLVLRFASLAGEIAWRPLYPPDAWLEWATKARVWYEFGRIVPFVPADAWLSGAPGVFFDAGPGNPATIPLLQLWSCLALGRWDDTAMNWPWLLMLIALALAIYGALRGEGVAPLLALVGTYGVAALPLLDVHVALAGYADLPLAAVYTLAALALYRWTRHRDRRDAGVALFFALCCPLIQTAGWVWVLTLAPGLVIALAPGRGMRIVGACFALAVVAVLTLERTTTTIFGYPLRLEFTPDWQSLAENYLLFCNWNLLWYGLIVLAAVARRRLGEPPLAVLVAVSAAGLAFLFVVVGFGDAVAGLFGDTTLNRATLPLAPILVVLGVLLWQRMTLPVPDSRPAAAAIPP